MTGNTQPPEKPSPNSIAAAPGLPTVEPPSGRHILQMFLVPGLIVAFIVGIAIGITWLFGGPRTPEDWLKHLRDPNPDIRWKAAADLAQYMLRDKELSSNAEFGLQLAAMLNDATQAGAEDEKALAKRIEKIPDKDLQEKEWQKIQGEAVWKTLEPQRKMVMFLAACLGNFTVPVGVPVLKEMAEQTEGIEPRGLAERRWRAVFALANLGQKLEHDYPALPDLRKDVIQSDLEKAQHDQRLAAWAGIALDEMKKRRDGQPGMMGLDATFEKITDPKSSDTFLREQVALALNFWTGTDAENEHMDRLLLTLTHDTGAGGELLSEMAAQNPDGFTPPEVRALLVAYNANIALANRGSEHVRVSMLADMLDEDYLREKMKTRRKDGTEITDPALVANTLLNTLKAVGNAHRKQPDLDLSTLRPAIDKLAGNSNKAIQTEAASLQKKLNTK